MSRSELFKSQKPETPSPALDMLHSAVYVGPLIWCLNIYDDHCASMFRRPPAIDELARRARGKPPMAPLGKRKRTLTLPLPQLDTLPSISSSVRRSRQRTDEQAKSLLLTKLPLELRQLIYAEVLAEGGKLIHILRKNGGLGLWRCRVQDGLYRCDSQGRRCVEGWLSYKTKVWNLYKTGRIDLITDDGLVPLLRTCRRMQVFLTYLTYVTDNLIDIPRL
jgi:hypothetical protein